MQDLNLENCLIYRPQKMEGGLRRIAKGDNLGRTECAGSKDLFGRQKPRDGCGTKREA